MLEVSGLTVVRGGKSILQNIDFSVSENSWLMLVGPNGAGKSTLLSALAGCLPFTGEIRLAAKPLRGMKPKERARHIGMLSQLNIPSADLTVRESVALGRYADLLSFRPLPDAEESVLAALDAVGMREFADRGLSSLSGGELQRVMLAQAFCQNPDILLLDEPANHLDLKQLKELFLLLDAWRKRPGKALLTVVHDLSLARHYGTDALVLDHGRIAAAGKTADCFHGETLRRVWGMDVPAYFREIAEDWRGNAP